MLGPDAADVGVDYIWFMEFAEWKSRDTTSVVST